jgi:hypothetical protein
MSSICCLSLSLSLCANQFDASALRKMIYNHLNLALFYAHPKTVSGQFEEEEEEGADWPRAILCFGLLSSCVSKTFQIYLLGTFSNVCSALN